MSWDEYKDIYKNAQNRKCPYKAFLIDVVNSKRIFSNNYPKYKKLHKLFNYISIELLKANKDTNKQIFRNDENNKLCLLIKNRNKYENSGIFVLKGNEDYKNLISNTMILGDCACYFTNNNTITDDKFMDIVKNGIKKLDIDFDLHFISAQYETDKYEEGGKKLYKGYMLQILEHFSKKEGKIISHNELEKLEK